MDTLQILQALNERERLPIEAIKAARADRHAMVPVILKEIEEFVATGHARVGDEAIFFAFHLLGEWREKSAYRPLAAFLRLPADVLEPVLGYADALTVHRVMAAVFDGDPRPLHEIVHDEGANQYIRANLLQAIAMLTVSGEIERAQTAEFLRNCYDTLTPREHSFVWFGWQETVARLGLADLEPLVQRGFERGSISSRWLRFADFEEDLQFTLDHPDAGGRLPADRAHDFTLFGDTIAEFQRWGFEQGYSTNQPLSLPIEIPTRNPFRHVGRNDPCPCGSGKKFKKCCLETDPDRLLGVHRDLYS